MMIWKKIDEIKVDLKRSYVVASVIYGYVVIAQWLILNKTVVVLPNILCGKKTHCKPAMDDVNVM